MDKVRSGAAQRKFTRIAIWIGSILGLIVLISVTLLMIQPSAPTVERGQLWVDTVKRGSIKREVRGLGTLQPEEVRWLTARTAARVERLVLLPGAVVQPGDAILEMSNPELAQELNEANLRQAAAEAELASLRVRLEGQVLEMQSSLARLEAELRTAELERSVNDRLFTQGLVAELPTRLARLRAEELATRFALETRRLEFTRESLRPQLAAQQSSVDQAKARADLIRGQVDGLTLRAPIAGVLQRLTLTEGQQVTLGQNLAQIADPTRLKAVVRIPETQARELRAGLPAMIDTRNGEITGEVARVDPNVEQGTVAVDVRLISELPRGARPDLTIDGRLQLEALDNIVYVARPTSAREGATLGVFRLTADGAEALRVPVRFGRTSVAEIEVLGGLNPGDRVVLSDTSAWDSFDRLRLK